MKEISHGIVQDTIPATMITLTNPKTANTAQDLLTGLHQLYFSL
jgi:hypothetical protein